MNRRILIGIGAVGLAVLAAFWAIRSNPKGEPRSGETPRLDGSGRVEESAQGGGGDFGTNAGVQAVTFPSAAAASNRGTAARKMIDGIEHIETRTQSGEIVWVPMAPEPPEETTDAKSSPPEFLPGPE